MQTIPLENHKNRDYQSYISLGTIGYYPLFFSEWLAESLEYKQNISYQKAGHNVKHIFKKLQRHNTLEKKKVALMGMDRLSRQEFIRSFLKIVEHETLKKIITLQ